MLTAGRSLRCWRVLTKECIWTHEPQGDFDWSEIFNFDAEMAESDHVIVIAVRLRASRRTLTRRREHK